MRKEEPGDMVDRENIAAEAADVSAWEIAGAIFLLLFSFAPLAVGWLFLRSHCIKTQSTEMQAHMAMTILGLYAFAVIVTFAIILLWGFRRLQLPRSFVHWLGAATVGEVAGIVFFVVRKVFP